MKNAFLVTMISLVSSFMLSSGAKAQEMRNPPPLCPCSVNDYACRAKFAAACSALPPIGGISEITKYSCQDSTRSISITVRSDASATATIKTNTNALFTQTLIMKTESFSQPTSVARFTCSQQVGGRDGVNTTISVFQDKVRVYRSSTRARYAPAQFSIIGTSG